MPSFVVFLIQLAMKNTLMILFGQFINLLKFIQINDIGYR
jgi:hypothetical protein